MPRETHPGAARAGTSKSDSHVWRTLMDAASKVQLYHAAKVERAASHGATPIEPLTGLGVSESETLAAQ
jgi:hypothetical protein